MSLTAFYDGSGKANDPGCRFVNLGALAGTDNGWADFNSRWNAALMKHNAPMSAFGTPYFHSKEAMHNSGGYKLWTADRVGTLLNDLLAVVGALDRSDVIAISCSVDLTDYRATKQRIPALKMPEELCLDWCVGTVLRHPARDSGIVLYFDRKEKFYSILRKVWKHKDQGRGVWWASYVTQLSEVEDMRKRPEIQAADLFAWLANRYHTHGAEDR